MRRLILYTRKLFLASPESHVHDTLSSVLRNPHTNNIKKDIKQAMYKIGFMPVFLLSRSGIYAHELLGVMIKDQPGVNPTQYELSEFTDNVTDQLSEHLASQFQNEGRNNTIGFLKTVL